MPLASLSDTDSELLRFQLKPVLYASTVEMWNAHHSISASEEESLPNRDVHSQKRGRIKTLRTAFSASKLPAIPNCVRCSPCSRDILASDSDDAAADIAESDQPEGGNEQCKSPTQLLN